MKNKKSIYILLPLVLIIWGVLAYRILGIFDENELTDDSPVTQFQNIKYKEPDSVKIVIDYRDPFSGKIDTKQNNDNISSIIRTEVETTIVQSEKTEIEPTIIYNGLVSDTKDKKKVFMLSVDRKVYLLEKGQEQDNIKIISGNTKEVVVLVNKKKEIVAISK